MGSVARVTEISTRSNESFQDAMGSGMERATKTLGGRTFPPMKEQGVDDENGEVSPYQVILKFTFDLGGWRG